MPLWGSLFVFSFWAYTTVRLLVVMYLIVEMLMFYVFIVDIQLFVSFRVRRVYLPLHGAVVIMAEICTSIQ